VDRLLATLPMKHRKDLFDADGTYDPMNRWNTTDGILRYIMPINSMSDRT
jgi:hypothetical protein